MDAPVGVGSGAGGRRRSRPAGVMPNASANSSSAGVGPLGSGDDGRPPDVASATFRSVEVSQQAARSLRRSAATTLSRRLTPAGRRVPRPLPHGPRRRQHAPRRRAGSRRHRPQRPRHELRQAAHPVRSLQDRQPPASAAQRYRQPPGLASSTRQPDPSGPPIPTPPAIRARAMRQAAPLALSGPAQLAPGQPTSGSTGRRTRHGFLVDIRSDDLQARHQRDSNPRHRTASRDV